jgi:hypothetical protein
LQKGLVFFSGWITSHLSELQENAFEDQWHEFGRVVGLISEMHENATRGPYSSVGKRSSFAVRRSLVHIQQGVPSSSALSKIGRCQGWVLSKSLGKFLLEVNLDIKLKEREKNKKNMRIQPTHTSIYS